MKGSIAARAVLAVAAICCVAAAHATSTVTSTFAAFSIGVSDLDPSDGVAPSVTLDPASTSWVFAGAGPDFLDPVVSWSAQGASAFGAASTSGDVGGTGGAASFSGDPFGAGTDIVASAHGGPSNDVGTAFAGIQNPGFYNLVTVSPHTEVGFFGTATIAWDASSPSAAAYGEVDLSLYLLDAVGQDFIGMIYATDGYYGNGSGDGPLSGTSPQMPLGLFYDNDSDQSVQVGYYVGVFASASDLESVPPPVDEPTDAALLLAGVAALLAVGRRGRAAARAASARRRATGRSAITVALLAAALPAVHATSTADATLSGLHIDLVDLAPTDGVAPSIVFSPGTASVAAAAAVSPGASTYWQQRGTSPFDPVATSGSLFDVGGAAAVAGDPRAGGATLTASAFANPSFAGGSGQAYLDNQPSGDVSFVLSAQSQVSFTGLATVQWNAGDPRGDASGAVQLMFWQFADGNFVTLASDNLVVGWTGVAGDLQQGSASRQVAVTFANTTDSAVTLDYTVLAQAFADEVAVPVTPVDEPPGAWLLLAGALPLAWAARRRRVGARLALR